MADIIEFPEANCVYTGDGNLIQNLPCYRDKNYTISCWKLTEEERRRVAETGMIWLSQMNYGSLLQPQAVWFESPFVEGEGQ